MTSSRACDGGPRRPARPSRRARLVRPLAALATAVVLAAAAPVAVADDGSVGEAELALRSAGQCPSGHFCLWSGPAFSGTFWSTSAGGVIGTPIPQARSVWNRSASAVRTYSGTSATGTSTCWAAGSQASSTSTPSVSIRIMGTPAC